MLTPKQIQEIADTLLPTLDSLNVWITRDMIRRLLARIGRGEEALLTASDEWQAQVLQEAGGHLEDVQAEIQRVLPLTDAEVARIFEDAAIKSLEADNRVYIRAGGRELGLSRRMLNLVEDAYRRTKGTLHNLTRTTATASQKKLMRALDMAHWKVQSGAQSYTSAVMDAVNEIADTQTEVVYPSGHVDTIETAVLRAVRTGTAQAAGNLSIAGMEEYGWDLIRVSAHLGARYGDGGENPGNHFWWQGKLYTRTGKYPEYPPFVETTGYGTGEGLCGWNCRHSFGPGDEHFNPFQDYDSEENKKAYDISQQQRKMERGIRKSKSKLMALQTAIDTAEDPAVKAELEAEYTKTAQRLKAQNKAYNQFCEDNGLKRYEDRLQVAKWGREQARRSIRAAKEAEKPLANPADSGIMIPTGRGIVDKRAMAMGLRKPVSHILTEDEIAQLKNDAQSIEVPLEKLAFNEGPQTGFRDRTEIIYVRGDVLPDENSTIARDRMSSRAVLAHEYYGHFKSHPSEYDPGDWRDEFRASYNAAVYTPNLTDEERMHLMVDAYDRAKEAGEFHGYDETARRIIYGF